MPKRERTNSLSSLAVSCQGGQFSLAYCSAQSFFAERNVEMRPCGSVKSVFDAVARGDSAYGVVAMESSSSGLIPEVYQELLHMAKGVQICADFSRADNLCLCVPGGATALNTGLDSVEEVHGHPHMLQACSIFLEKTRVDREAKGVKLGLTERASQDSTSAHSAASKTSAAALIAGRDTAQNLQMVVLSPDVCNDRRSQSRYIIVSKEDPLEIRHSAKAVSSKTTLTVLMRNSPGAIFKLASCFALREMDIINLSQRPAVNAFALHSQLPEAARGALLDHWSVIYFLEFASGGKEKDIAALRDLEEYSLWLKVCGTYASGIEDVSAKPSKAWQELSEKLSTSY